MIRCTPVAHAPVEPHEYMLTGKFDSCALPPFDRINPRPRRCRIVAHPLHGFGVLGTLRPTSFIPCRAVRLCLAPRGHSI